MNNDLISRTKLLNKISGLICYEQRRSGIFETRCEAGLLVAKELAKSAPAVDAEPVRRGEWTEPYKNDIWDCYVCSSCGYAQDRTSRYCPGCGAKMDGDVSAAD